MPRCILILLAASCLFAQSAPPEIKFDFSDPLQLPDGMNLGEAAGVAVNSKGHIFVFHRGKGAQLLEFDQNGKYLREIGKDLYGFSFAHVVRIDKDDNIWCVDEGANMVIKFNPQGRVLMLLGRKPEAVEAPRESHEIPPARANTFNRPTDVTWDTDGNIYIADGYNNSRVAKISKDGDWIKAWGKQGADPGDFHTVHSIAIDNQNRLYVGDRENNRIQVFDTDGKFLRMFSIDVPPAPGTRAVNGATPTGERLKAVIGQPNSLCIPPSGNVMFVFAAPARSLPEESAARVKE